MAGNTTNWTSDGGEESADGAVSTGGAASAVPIYSELYGTLRTADNTLHVVLGSITLMMCVAILLGDILLLLYFYTQKSRVSSQIYLYLLMCDMVIGLTGIFVAFDMLLYTTKQMTVRNRETKEEKIFLLDNFSVATHSFLRILNSYIYALVSRMSCMINCYLSVVRAIVIVSPFSNIKGPAVMASLGTYNLTLAIVLLICFLIGDGRECSHLWMICEPALPIENTVLDVVALTGIPYVLPCVPVMVSCALIIGKQLTMPEFEAKMKSGTRTIIYVSVLFVFCNSVFFITAFVDYKVFFGATGGYQTDPNYDFTDTKDLALYFTIRTFSTFFNAFGNVVILLWRSSGVRHFIKQIWRREVSLGTILAPRSRRSTGVAPMISGGGVRAPTGSGGGGAQDDGVVSRLTVPSNKRVSGRISVLTSPVSPILVEEGVKWHAEKKRKKAEEKKKKKYEDDDLWGNNLSSDEEDEEKKTEDSRMQADEDGGVVELPPPTKQGEDREERRDDKNNDDDDDLWGYNLSDDSESSHKSSV